MGLFQPSSSPAITVREIDLTGTAPNVSTSLSGLVGDFQWGPVDQIVRVQDVSVLSSTFGTPDISNAVDFLSAEYFLKYSQNLNLVRAVDSAAYNGICGADSSATITIKNYDDYEAQKSLFGADSADVDTGQWISKYPGDLGNSISVSICSKDSSDSDGTTSFDAWAYKNQFDTAPGTSDWAAERNASDDEVHIAVVDRLGKFTGTPGAVLEVFPYVSVALGAKTVDGGNNYIADVINLGSNYIWFGYFSSNAINGTNWGTEPDQQGGTDYSTGVTWTDGTSTENLLYGANSGSLGTAEYINSYALFSDPESIEIDMLVCPGMNSQTDQTTVVNNITSIAESRKDCVVVASPNRAAVVGNSTPVTSTVATTNTFTASNYLVVDNNYLKVYDKYNGQYVSIPAASSTAGIMALTDYNYGPWYSPAGEKRGQYVGVTSLAYSPNKSERDTLYKVGVNSIVSYPGRGVVLWGDKTKQSRPSAFDRINVRRLFLALEKSISQAARNVMFEFNDEFTRADFVGIIEPVLREVQGRRGITDYYVQCDETNNTPEVIDRNELVASIYIKPVRSVNYITLNFVAVRTGVDFDEVVGRV